MSRRAPGPVRVLRGVGLVVAAVAVALSPGSGRAAPDSPALEVLLGQRLIVAMEGTSPSSGLLRRIQRGQVGGVILFGANISSGAELELLTGQLRRAAEAGGRPRLLVAVDQEGGAIRRLRWAPPGLAAIELGRRSIASSRAAGLATAKALRMSGVDVDLAPVADVPVRGSFLLTQQRVFGLDSAHVASRSAAFASGLASGSVVATAKHFPGLGRAMRTTDEYAVTIHATRAELRARDLVPFRRLVAAGVPLVMLSNASYAAYGGVPAAWSSSAVAALRDELGFSGVVVTDALDALVLTRHVTLGEAARRAVLAGADALLVTGSERESARLLSALVTAARAGRIPSAMLREGYDRMLALKLAAG